MRILRKFKPDLILLALLLPLVFLNIDNNHDWGDDFAQYLVQAENIFNWSMGSALPCMELYSPIVKGPLFSWLLSPLTLFPEYLLYAAKLLVGLFLVIALWVFTKLIARQTGKYSAALMAVFVGYNYHVILLKDQVLPDSLFMSVLIAGFLIIEKSKQTSGWYLLLISLLLIWIKPAGILFIITLVLIQFIPKYRLNDHIILWIGIPLVIIISWLPKVLITGTWNFDHSGIWYWQRITGELDWHQIPDMFHLYLSTFKGYFSSETHWLLNSVVQAGTSILLFSGLIIGIYRKNVVSVFSLIYLTVLIIYPYYGDPYRLLWLLFPFLIYHCVLALGWISNFLFRMHGEVLSIPFMLIMIILNIPNLLVSLNGERNPPRMNSDGTNELISFVKEELDENDVISTTKPWAIHWLTRAITTPMVFVAPADEMNRNCEPDYVLFIMEADGMDRVLALTGSYGDPVFSNGRFAIFRYASNGSGVKM